MSLRDDNDFLRAENKRLQDAMDFRSSKHNQKHAMCRDLTAYRDKAVDLMFDVSDFLKLASDSPPEAYGELCLKYAKHLVDLAESKIYTHLEWASELDFEKKKAEQVLDLLVEKDEGELYQEIGRILFKEIGDPENELKTTVPETNTSDSLDNKKD